MKVLKNGEKVDMSYGDICKELGFCADVHFVKITTRGTITFTAGKPNEIQALYRAATSMSYKPAKKLIDLEGR